MYNVPIARIEGYNMGSYILHQIKKQRMTTFSAHLRSSHIYLHSLSRMRVTLAVQD